MASTPPTGATEPPEDAPSGEGRGPEPRPIRRAGPLLVGFSISLVLHVAVVVVYPVLMRRLLPEIEVVPVRPVAVRPAGTRVVQLAEVPEQPAPVEPEPEEEPEPEPLEEEAPASEVEEGVAEEEEEAPTAAEILRPRAGDPRLWRFQDPSLTELSEEERARIRRSLLFRALGDSLAAAEERAARALDWTFTDEEGNTWGISPGRLHLGKLTLPLPIGFSPPQDVVEYLREFDQMERAAARAAVEEIWRERARAIRERKDAERAQQSDSTGSRPPL